MIRVLAADDHPIVLEGLSRLLSKQADMRLVGEASDGNELVRLAKDTLADVVLLDISMPGPGFADVIRAHRPAFVPTAPLPLRVTLRDEAGNASKEWRRP